MIVHIVALRFKEHLTEEQIKLHFEQDVNLQHRMPELVESWCWRRNLTLDSRADVNLGCNYVVVCRVKGGAQELQAYLQHPQHLEVGRIQGPLLLGKFVVDIDDTGSCL